jgi:hypothetical protein
MFLEIHRELLFSQNKKNWGKEGLFKIYVFYFFWNLAPNAKFRDSPGGISIKPRWWFRASGSDVMGSIAILARVGGV